MEQTNQFGFLDLIEHPAFCVKSGKIIACNRSAVNRQFSEGQDIMALLDTHAETYEAFVDGLLYLQISVDGTMYDATVTRTPDGDIFVLDTRFSNDALQAMALAAQHLRNQLGSVMAQAADSPQNGGVMKGLYRLQRMLCNMSDIPLYRSKSAPAETLELGSVVYEIVEKAAALLEDAQYRVEYRGIQDLLFTTGDREMIERAVFNLLSNAAKYAPKGSTLRVSLVKKERVALISVEDSGTGIDTGLYATLFSRYMREPSISGGQDGIGLGMALVQTVAAYHGGTVLVTKPASGGTKVTLSLSLRTPKDVSFRSPIVSFTDYAGGNDHGLLELSDVLPPKSYNL